PAGAEDHAAPGRHQPRVRDHRAVDRRLAARRPRSDPRGADGRHPSGSVRGTRPRRHAVMGPAPPRTSAHAWYATGAYTLITLVLTWPLAKGLGRNVAWDLGESVLNMWILSWDCEQFRAILAGQFSHLRHFFDANIFHPAPLTLAYSEHLIPQAVQIFPVYALTGNPILCYNLLFLSTFVLSGLGMFLFARELTGSTVAAFVGG